MKKINFLAIFFLVFTTSLSFASKTEPILSSYWIPDVGTKILSEVGAQFEIESRSGQGFEVIVPEKKSSALLRLVPSAKLIEKNITEAINQKLQNFKLSKQDLKYRYHSLDEVQTMMQTMVQQYPTMAQLITYGKSQQGRALVALKMTSNLSARPNKPRVMLTAATHGDELITTEVLLDLMSQLLAGASANEKRFLQILENHEIFFIPVLNADGFVKHNRYDNGADPNRSYPYPDDPQALPTASIAAVMNFFNEQKINASIDFHAYSGLIMYPWAYTEKTLDAAETKRFEDITSKMAASNGYEHGPIATTIYIAKGSSADYYYWKTKSLSLAIEMGNSKVPDPTQIPSYITDQAEATWLFLEAVQ